jgi:hypothetical protein
MYVRYRDVSMEKVPTLKTLYKNTSATSIVAVSKRQNTISDFKIEHKNNFEKLDPSQTCMLGIMFWKFPLKKTFNPSPILTKNSHLRVY